MHANNIKNWNSSLGDYNTPEDLDYSKKYELAKSEERGFVNKVSLVFGLFALGAVIVILEVFTRL